MKVQGYMAIYITGDTHAEFQRFSTRLFPVQKELTKDDYVIICGDFGGVFLDSAEERHNLKWLSEKPFTILFVDGNHENYDRLYSNEFETVEFCGGMAHKITDSVYHLMRGYVFTLSGRKFFAFGGALSHDIDDGILDIKDYTSQKELLRDYNRKTADGKLCRINHLSWWKEELPSGCEMALGRENLKKHNYKIDYVISHCLPQSKAVLLTAGKLDKLTRYFDELLDSGLDFKEWHCGHYHTESIQEGKFIVHYEKIERLI